MASFRSVLLTGLFVTSTALAQLLPEPAVPAFRALSTSGPFDDSFQVYPRTYASNEAFDQNDRLFKGLFKTDPRLLMGVSLTPNLAIEAGYLNFFDKGFHRIDLQDAGDTAGALNTKGHSIHVAARYTVPLGERVSAYGKLGLAHSYLPEGKLKGTDRGLYTGVGAAIKVNERTSIQGEFANHGRAARKWGDATNASGLKADLKMGF